MAQKQPEFTVTDRRKFTEEGDLRSDVVEQPQAEAPPASKGKEEKEAVAADQPAPAPPSPSAEEQSKQQTAYHASSRKLDEMLDAAGHPKPKDMEVSFPRIVESYYMTALMQLGAIRMEGEEPRVDIIGARQTIDTLAVLNDKTKGNLTEQEQSLLQNAMFELRMLFLEITNAISRQAASGPPKTGTIKK